VFNLRIHPYVHGKCSYYMKIIISRGRNSGRRRTIVQDIRGCSIKKTAKAKSPGLKVGYKSGRQETFDRTLYRNCGTEYNKWNTQWKL